MSVKLISVTPDAEKNMAYVARVSNPNNQENPNYAKLLGYCIKHNHWSVFEQSFMTLEIETTRGLAAQILRHRSFTYQEFSQRYADSSMLADTIPLPELRDRTLRIVRTLLMISILCESRVSSQDAKTFRGRNESLSRDARVWNCKGMCSICSSSCLSH